MTRACGLLVTAVWMLALCAPAGAQQVGPEQPDGSGTDTLVTIAARECDNYTDIRANLARNNIMESLQDLGADTLYSSGDQIDPRTELKGQPRCRPLVGWRFTLGDAYQSRVDTGVWGSLSKVTGVDATSIVTQASVPLRGYDGRARPGRSIAAATTIELSSDQLSRSGGNRLWLQGGEPGDPVLYGDPFFAGRYGFGALRCAIDDLNGDNVETIQYPSGVRHVFCYAYYVTPPPASGTIVIRKQVQGENAPSETFGFGGNVSYNAGGAFDLTAGPGSPASTTFYRAETRAGDDPWTVVENVPPGWALTGIDCTAPGGSTVATDLPGRRVSIALVAGDTVTCTYTDRSAPTQAAIIVRKITEGGVGRFGFRVRDEDGASVATRSARTTQPGVAAGAGAPIVVDPGRYTLSEQLPPNRDGKWKRVGARCNDREFGPADPVTGVVTAGSGAVCTFTNRLVLPGKLTLAKITLGGTGTAGFVVSPLGDPTVQRRQFATTSRPGRPARARGQSLNGLAYGRYAIQESTARPEELGNWTLVAVVCGGDLIPFSQGRAVVRLSRSQPELTCRFINQRNAPGPDPDPPGPDPVPGGGGSDVTIAKRLVATTGGNAPIQTWRVTVTNGGEVSANGVVVTDQLARGMALVSARAPGGSCFDRGDRVICSLGGLGPGADRTITVKVRRFDKLAGTNVAVVGTSSPDRTGNNTAKVSVAGAYRQRVCAAGGPLARAAC